jgi:hypothetical protein
VLILFCDDPLSQRAPDPSYAAEAEAVRTLGAEHALVGYEALVGGDAAGAVRRVPASASARLGVYRGWMLRPERYAALHAALAARGVALINDPAAYRHCHYLPESYPAIEPWTPRSVWLPVGPGFALARVHEALRPFGSAPVIVKDYVKSQKHAWREACFIPDASDRAAVERVVGRFLQLQGEDLAEGLVFREYVELESAGTHPRSGMPLAREFRLFVLDGEPLATFRYWSEGDYGGDAAPPLAELGQATARVRSRFFTMDVARRTDGRWIVVELGDGQVAGLPDDAAAGRFYGALLARLRTAPPDR